MTVHAAKGLEFEVVAVPDLGRGLAQGERPAATSSSAGSPAGAAAAPAARFGMRLALPAAKSFGLWELAELNGENVVEAEAEEGCRWSTSPRPGRRSG